MIRIFSERWFRRLGLFILVVLIVAGMASTLNKHGESMLHAASGLSLWSLSLALVLSVVYRLVNASGWGLILRVLGEPVDPVASARIWLASEACRWLPGSLWSFGSRAVLASRRGVAGPVVASSLVLELAVTVIAWVVLAATGFWSLKWPTGWSIQNPRAALTWSLGAVVLVTVGFGLSRSPRIRSRLAGLRERLSDLRQRGIERSVLFKSFFFFLVMGLFNGAILVVIIRSTSEGSNCPIDAIIAANALAWLVGFFAIFAPGGLIVREACLASLLGPWLSPSEAIAIALAWRLIQILAEILCFAIIAATGLPNQILNDSENEPLDSMPETCSHLSEQIMLGMVRLASLPLLLLMILLASLIYGISMLSRFVAITISEAFRLIGHPARPYSGSRLAYTRARVSQPSENVLGGDLS